MARAQTPPHTPALERCRVNCRQETTPATPTSRPALASSRSRGAIPAGSSPVSVIDVLNLSVGKARFMDLKDPRHNRDIPPPTAKPDLQKRRIRDDAKGILFMIWLRSGGGIATTHAPDAVLKVDGER